MNDIEEALCEVAEKDADRNKDGVGYAASDDVYVIYTKSGSQYGRDLIQIGENKWRS